MENFTAKDLKIFEDMKQCVKDFGLKDLGEEKQLGILSGFSTFEYPGYNMGILYLYDPLKNVANISIRYADAPPEKIPSLYELFNYINKHLTFNHFAFESLGPFGGMILLTTGLKVTEYFLNKAAFKMLLKELMGVGHTFMPLIAKLLFTDNTPKSIMDEFYEKNCEKIPVFVDEDGKIKEPKMTKELPFIIHASADMPAFPTHTHGLTELGIPEFLIDHLCIGAKGNGACINLSYKYFIKPENADKLDAIKNGQVIRLTFTDLKPEAKTKDLLDPDRVYCYHRVYPEFEMVKQAYNIDDQNNQSDADPTAWFVQIYVEGDDFALTDDYYKDGIKW